MSLLLLFQGAPSAVVFGWYTDLSTPQRRKPTLKNKEYLFFVQRAAANLNGTYSVAVSSSVPTRKRTTQYQTTAISYNLGTLETVTLDKWFVQLNEPLRRNRGYARKNQLLAPFLAFETHYPAVYSVPLVQQFEAGPTKTRRRQYQTYVIGFDPRYLEFVSPDKWFKPLNEPTRPRRNRIIGPDLAYVKHIPTEYQTAVIDLIDVLPTRQRRRLYQTIANQFELPVAVVVALVSSWYEDLNKPAKRKRRQNVNNNYTIGLDPSGYPVPGVRRPREYSNQRYKDRYGMNIKSYGSRGLRR